MLLLLLPGEGRVHQCLRFHRSYISEACKNEEMKLAAVEYRDVRLRPKLNKICSEERAVYCKVCEEGMGFNQLLLFPVILGTAAQSHGCWQPWWYSLMLLAVSSSDHP